MATNPKQKTDSIHDLLVRAYRQNDDVAFDSAIQQLLNIGAILPPNLQAHVDNWIQANDQQPDKLRWGRFPLGMVQGWIERAEEAERQLASVGQTLSESIQPRPPAPPRPPFSREFA